MSDHGNLDRTTGDAPRQGDDPPTKVNAAALGAGFLIVAILVLVLAWSGFTGDSKEADPDAGTDLAALSSPSDSAAPPARRSGANTRLARCAQAVEVLRSPLDAARPAMDQWALHIDAMNQLVVGEITLQQAAKFWDRTRVGAQRNVDAFRAAESALRDEGVDCPRPDLLGPGSRALPACAREVETEVDVLRSARVSVEMWEHHVHQMDMLRLGKLTPERATRLWLGMWRRGQRDLADYREAVRGARQGPRCDTSSITP
jgi:hypothetical protein